MTSIAEPVAAGEESFDGAVVLGDQPLRPADVVAVARGRRVLLGHAARTRMGASPRT